MVVPTSPGSRLADRARTLPQVVRSLMRRVDRLDNRATSETALFVPNDSTRWEPISSGGADDTPWFTHLYRRGRQVAVTVMTEIPAAAVISVHLWYEDQNVAGTAVSISQAIVGTRAATLLTFEFPETWVVGAVGKLWIRGHRTDGSGTSRIAVLRVAQR